MNKLIILDYNIFLFRAIFAWRKNKEIPPTYTCLNMMLSALRKIGIDPFDEIILACDGIGNWRREYDESYKANRKAFRESFEDINWKEMFNSFDELLGNLNAGTDWHTIKIDKCLTGNTLIKTKNRDKYICDIKAGNEVLTYNFQKNNFEYCKVTKTFKNKYKKYYKIKFFESDKKLKLTGNHSVFTSKGWKKTENLKINDVIYSYEDYNLLTNENNKFELGYLYGLIKGDGWFNYSSKRNKYECRIQMVDIEPIIFIQKILQTLFAKNYKILDHEAKKTKWKKTKSIAFSSKSLLHFFNSLKEHQKDINFMKGFISAFYDAEGTLTKRNKYKYGLLRIANTNVNLIKYCGQILSYFGIYHRTYYFKEKRKNRKNIYAIDINKQQEIRKFFEKFYPLINRKKPKTLKNGYAIRQIKYIQTNKKSNFYNLENKNHNYFANGLLVHNCEADDIASVACRYFKDKEIILVSYDSDWEMLWHYDNVKIFSILKKYKGIKGSYKVKPDNFNAFKLLSKKIEKETTDNLVNPILNEEDYENRKVIVNLLELPEFIESQIVEEFEKLKDKDDNLDLIPYKSLREKLGNLYNDKAKIINYKSCVERELKKKLKKKKVRSK